MQTSYATIVFAFALAACADPVHDRAVDALGPEKPGVPPGPTHRPGQPCLTCHGGDGPADPVMAFGGTVFGHATGHVAAAGATVRLVDANQKTFETKTNCAGNFWVPQGAFDATFPVQAAVTLGDVSEVMRTEMRDGLCNSCHAQPEGASSAGQVWVLPAASSVTAPTCPPERSGHDRGYLGGKAGIVHCPEVSGDCPSTPPSYAKDVAPILAAHCVGCHGPGGENSDVLLDTYAACTVAKRRTTVPDLVTNCLMPPPPLPPLSADEITTLQCWFPLLHPPR